jgi:hypothetical protein
MSTHSRIGYKTPEGNYCSIYCHYDGYEAHVGRMLVENYNTEKLTKELISNGSASSIGASIEDSIFYFRNRDGFWDAFKPKELPFTDVHHIREEYNYCFIDGEWYGFTYDIGDKYSVSEFLKRN